MLPNLMADDELPRNVFPKTEVYLFVGGPKHGQRLEVVRDDPTHRVISAPQPPAYMSGSLPTLDGGGHEIHTYLMRKLAFETDDGDTYTRTVYVHDQVPNAAVAQHLLSTALLADFVKGGRKVVTNEPNRGSTSGH